MAARLALALALLLARVGALSAQPAVVFSPALPDGIVDVSGWQVVSGDFETAEIRGGYRLYVNPARAAMYQLMRYRIDRGAQAPPEHDPRLGVERVAYIRNPGVREPLVCWLRQPPGSASEWRQVQPGTREYQLEMGLLMQILSIHRTVRRSER